ncbi:MAG: esterase [Microbacteriaceae bacterium]|nr:esterase [Microbacteriaceae bacterium]
MWTNRANRVGWASSLAGATGADTLPPYAAAARREDLSGLPPTFIAVGDIELFLAEDTDYAHRLQQAGVSAQLEVEAGAPHGFENWARRTEPAMRLMMKARWWLRKAFARGPTVSADPVGASRPRIYVPAGVRTAETWPDVRRKNATQPGPIQQPRPGSHSTRCAGSSERRAAQLKDAPRAPRSARLDVVRQLRCRASSTAAR